MSIEYTIPPRSARPLIGLKFTSSIVPSFQKSVAAISTSRDSISAKKSALYLLSPFVTKRCVQSGHFLAN
jgi:hypothetical protein